MIEGHSSAARRLRIGARARDHGPVKLHAEADYYTILGVDRGTDDATIKRAYRGQARNHHPDLPSNKGNPAAASRFKLINEAYEVLSDPRKKMLYDRFGKRGLSEQFKDWIPPEQRKKRPKIHAGHEEELETEAGSDVASIFEDLFAKAGPTGAAKKRNEDLWNPANLDQGPVDEPEPLRRAQQGGNKGGSKGGGATAGGRFGPGGFSMSDLKEGLKAAAGYGGHSEGGGDKSDGPAPAWTEAMTGGPVDEAAYSRDRGSSMPRFHQQGEEPTGPRGKPRSRPAGRGRSMAWEPPPEDEDEWVDGGAGPAGWDEPNPADGWIRDNNKNRVEPEPPEHQGPSKRTRRGAVDAQFSAGPRGERRRDGRDVAPRAGDDLHAVARIPLLTAVHGGRHTVSLRVPAADGSWCLEAVELNVPPGMEQGGTLRLRGQGHHGDGDARRGDLVLSLEVAPDSVFRIDGRDVVLELPLRPTEAAGGCRLEVPTLFGTAQVTVPPGIGSGQQIRLRGMGLPPLDARSRKGDQLLTVQIQLPNRLSRKQLELLEQVEDGFDPRRDLWDT